MDRGQEFLTIKQAAKFLNVSEISLRRWTDSGKLDCVRIGGKRERRFHRDDLLGFLNIGRHREHQTTKNNNKNNKSGKDVQVFLEGMAINYGTHLCALYETDVGCLKLSIPFLSDGLRKGDYCYLIAPETVQKKIINHLNDAGIDVNSYIKEGQLILHKGHKLTSKVYDFFEKNFIKNAGNNACIRILGDMAWAIENGATTEEILEFELKYSHSFAKSFPVIALCQYDVTKFDGPTILNALKCHQDTFDFPISRFLNP